MQFEASGERRRLGWKAGTDRGYRLGHSVSPQSFERDRESD